MVRTRIAPTPSGNLHIGTAHTALFNYLYAKHSGGKFILRIDDSDPKRSKPGFEKDIVNSLKWLGLDWDEGPDIGGNYGPYRQSERMNHYWPYINKLIKEGKAYYCYCSLEELDVERKQQQALKQAPKYSGKCRNLSKDQIEAYKKEGRVPTVRLKVPEKEVSFIDPARGKISVNTANFGDFIIARSDKTALLIVATTIDDIEMKVTHAIRGEDYINFVPRQIVLFEALGVKPPVFAHLPFVYASDGSKLSKRHGAVAISEYREQGFLPEAVFNYLTLLGWSAPENQEILNKEETIELFTLERVNTNPHRFNLTKLEWINGEYLRKLTISNFQLLITNFYKDKLPEDIVKKTIPLVRERMKKLSDYLGLCEFFFKRPEKYLFSEASAKLGDIDVSVKKDLLKKIHDTLSLISDWRAKLIGEKMQELAKKEGVETGKFFMTLRVVITGKKISPPLNESMEILGKDETLGRLKKLQ